FPTIEITNPSDLPAFAAAVDKLGEQDWLIFVSKAAVYKTIPALKLRWPHLPETVRFAAIGKGTESALRDAGYQSVLVPASRFDSESLLALPEFQSVRNKKIALLSGENGRLLLRETFIAHGATLLPVIAY